MNSVQIEENVKDLVQNISNQSLSRDDFVFELLLAYGHRKSVVSRVKSGERNLSKNSGEVILKRHLYFKPCTTNLFAEIDELKKSKTTSSNKIRFVVVTDFNQLIAVDTKTQDTLDIELNQLSKHFDFFLPWAGMEKMVYRGENPADVKAAEKMADFFDHIKELNYPPNASKEQLHDLVVFLNRLLFCFFAEDTKIFGDNQFTNLLNQHTSEDGSDVATTFQRLFEVLNTAAHQRGDLPQYLASFPYVNGGLFKKDLVIPSFDAKARRMLLDSGQLDWADINPDIFGSMIQGVADPETRSKMGMHYTSVTNIMKVIEPLFLNDFYDEFEKCKDTINKLRKLQVRLSRIKIFDPACGSGNFLIIAYKEIRLLEIEILKRIRELEGESDSGAMGLFDESHSSIRLDQFYGIELDDFAHEMAILSLWLVEHQMNMVFETEFGYTAPTLPLKQSGRIVSGNATRIDWNLVCPCTNLDEVYILGNPPYLGAKELDKIQKEDMNLVFSKDKKVKRLDYISCWFKKASDYIVDCTGSYAFVSTNSICQGEQVSLLWPYIYKLEQRIFFAFQSFDWSNNAKKNAGVTCVIVGICMNASKQRNTLFLEKTNKNVSEISPYLIESKPTIIPQRTESLCNLPKMILGSSGFDGGHLILTTEEKVSFLSDHPTADKFIKRFYSGSDYINNSERYCLWIQDEELEEALSYNFIQNKVNDCYEFRINGGRDAKKAAAVPHRFFYRTHQDGLAIIFPKTTSGRRLYVPAGFSHDNSIVSNATFVIYNPEVYVLGILLSRMHSIWMATTSARMRNDYRYSVNLTYNNFPLPELNQIQKDKISDLTYEILSVREMYPERSLGQLYDPVKMPNDLLSAHQNLDRYIEGILSPTPIASDDERLSCLFSQYEKLEARTYA
ncbi:class I SAM-dependent DNA methyltransferase [Photobacterium makurazakiensis]|uniref:DNA methyltransferase n=1 Tax=Photobacterium makurazakiensis TaxID=2910234 RepID=UPI003D14C5AB